MSRFGELEEEHQRTPVTLDMVGQSGHGVLRLDREKTQIHLSSPKPLEIEADEKGWFDLHLKSSREQRIIVRNGLFTQPGLPNRSGADVESAIFPNFIALRAEHLTPTGHVTEITFTAAGLIDFFYYDVIEVQPLYGATPELKRALKKVRTIEKRNPREYEFFLPSELHLIHRLPRAVEFRVAERQYEVFLGLASSSSHTARSVRAVPLATIKFDLPIPIEAAVGHAWDWRRFFSQIAMQPLPFESMRARAKGRPRGVADLYLPNLREEASSGRGMYNFNPGAAPFNGWKERKQLAALMRGWLEKQPARRIFRALLETVIRELQEHSSPHHIMWLAAGIESLAELDVASPYSKADVKTLVQGALSAAQKAGIAIEKDRVQGLLAGLRKQNLSRRLELVGNTVKPVLTEDPAPLIRAAQAIRNGIAHGNEGVEASMPKVLPVTRALAAICAIWDQQTSGLSLAQLNGRFHPLIVATHSIRDLKQQEAV